MEEIAIVSDLHIDSRNSKAKHLKPRNNAIRILNELADKKFNKLIVSGDVSDSVKGLGWLINEIESRRFDYKIMPGNHDNIDSFYKSKLDADNLFYSSARIENFKVLFLDTGSNSVSQDQIDWLEAEIKDIENDLLLFIHHPVLDLGNTMMDKKYPLKNRDEIKQILNSIDNKIHLFCGHYHTEATVCEYNIIQYVTPSVLYQFKKHSASANLEVENERIGYRVLTVKGNKIITYVNYLEA